MIGYINLYFSKKNIIIRKFFGNNEGNYLSTTLAFFLFTRVRNPKKIRTFHAILLYDGRSEVN